MAKTHNKKRNVGVIYELLLHHVSKCLVESDDGGHTKARKILKKHFKTSTEIYKEFRIFNALVKTTVSSDSIAGSILREAKSAIRDLDVRMLEREKSLLIRDINHQINDDNFYKQYVCEYRMYATIQTLFNDWRAGANADLGRVARYEDNVVEWLLKEKTDVSLPNDDVDADNLIVKIMTEKFNDKFNDALNDEQKSIIREYVFAASGESKVKEQLHERLSTLRDETASCLCEYANRNERMSDKINQVRDRVIAETSDDITDETINKFLQLSKLKHEIELGVSDE